MLENNLITFLLAFHDGLIKVKSLSPQGKSIVANLCNLLTQRDIIKKSEARILSPTRKYLYLYTVRQIQKKICQGMSIFESQYFCHLISTKNILTKITVALEGLMKNLTFEWIHEKNAQFRFKIFELIQILFRIESQYAEQVQFLSTKWRQYSHSLIQGQKINEDLKFFLLHISFDTYIESQLLQSWDEIITGLQNKRYK